MIYVRYHRDDGTDFAAFGYRGGSEDGEVSVAGKVARTADTVHHLGSYHVGAVYISVYIGFQGGIDGYQSHAAHQLGVVGNFARTKYDFVAEEIDVGEYPFDDGSGNGQRTSTGKFATALFHQTR